MSNSARFFGLDLAWSTKNPTGACVVDTAGVILDERLVDSDNDIVTWIGQHLDGPAVVAIDAPLTVPNQTGRRPCESELSRDYGARKASPHPSNRERLLKVHDQIRGETLVKRLAKLGFHDPWQGSERTVLEVYPHPALVEMFDLPERHKYKKGPVTDRRIGLRRLSEMVSQLNKANPALIGHRIDVADETRGRALKGLEDQLDARVCAWIASVWHHRQETMRLYGDSITGHIAVPVGRFF